MTDVKNQRLRCGTTAPMLRVRPEARLDASEETTYPSSDAAWTTRARVRSETGPLPLRARETVAVETPARRATSSIPGIPPPASRVVSDAVEAFASAGVPR